MNFHKKLKMLFKSQQVVKFDNLVQVAHEIKAQNPLALYDFVNLILKPMQSEVNLVTAELGTGVVKQIGLKHLFSGKMGSCLYDPKKIDSHTDDTTLNLGRDIAFTRPWNRQRYIDNLCYLASRQPEMEPIDWREDYNHYVTLVLPWRFFLVGTGNHSMMAGIATGLGEVTPQEINDYSWLLSKFHTDGRYWFDSETNKKIDSVKNYRGAAVFEIGRLFLS